MPIRFEPRPAQRDILKYTGGWMGVSAVPGSGKTFTLSAMAATLLMDDRLAPEQEVLIVTLVNSAVQNFAQRIAGFLEGSNLLPDIGYRVRTLHGLAHDILRERPDLVGLSDRFQIIDERESQLILNEISTSWLKSHPQFIEMFVNPDLSESNRNNALRQLPELVSDVAHAFIRIAKDSQVSPSWLINQIKDIPVPPLLLQMGIETYIDYERALSYRSAVDFDDLIRLALQALQSDPDFLDRLRYRWPFILEDEAQDSSRLQEEILKLLAAHDGNWVRVGDPNQAIYETFTTANPKYLRDFLNSPAVTSLTLPNSGRSTQSIIDLANHLIYWVKWSHPHEQLRDALTEPYIQPSPPGDPQSNPEEQGEGIYLSRVKFTPEKEIDTVINSIRNWLPLHRDNTVAILVPRNERGAKAIEALKQAGIPHLELLGSSQSTRQTADLLASVLRYLADPTSTAKLVHAYRQLSRREEGSKETQEIVQTVTRLLQNCPRVEDYLTPRMGPGWLSTLDANTPAAVLDELNQFRALLIPWLEATALPIDQLLLTVAMDIFSIPADLALSHKLALVLEGMSKNHPEWSLPEFCEELSAVARNQRKFLGFSEDDTGFDPDKHKGKVVVTTIHKAKGLEWDRVYMISVNNYDFPSLMEGDSYISEKWYIRNQLNLEAESLSLLKGLIESDPSLMNLEEGIATQLARIDYASERLRLLYVGITRAKCELMITWNSGRDGNMTAALPLLELQRFLEEDR